MADDTTTPIDTPTTVLASADVAATPVPAVTSPTPVAANDPAPAVPVPPVAAAEPVVCEPVDHAAIVAEHGGVEALLVKLHEDMAFLRGVFGWPEKK